jgi:hypothetical protein
MDASWIIMAKDQGKVIRTMIYILLLGMYSVRIEQECENRLKQNWEAEN